MTDNIKPEHYRTGEIDLYESWYRTYPFGEYRAIMQAVAERYMRRDKNNRVEDLNKAIYTLERLKEKEIEYAGEVERVSTKDGDIILKRDKDSESIYLLKGLLRHGFEYLARDFDGDLWMYQFPPKKGKTCWYDGTIGASNSEKIDDHSFPEVGWSDNEPTKIAELLESYENGGENGKYGGVDES